MKKRLALTAAVCAAAVLWSLPAAAAPCCDNQAPESYFEKMSVKFWRGIVNVVTCPVEIPKQVYTVTRDRGAPGPFVGLLKGAFMTVYRGVGGAVEAVSFPVPAPKDYEPLLTPDYVWNGWGKKSPPPPLTISEAVSTEEPAKK